MQKEIIGRSIIKVMIPLIQLYGLYVIGHGEDGPGGGFQGGVILGASIILYALVFGLKEGKKRIVERKSDFLCSAGVLIYGGIGLLCLLAGGNYLNYAFLPLGHEATHLGIMGIEIGVGITVAAVMITLFFETVGREEK